MTEDVIHMSKGMEINLDLREIAVLICEGTLRITRPEGMNTEQAYDHIDRLNAQAHEDFTRAALKVLGYIEAQLLAAGGKKVEG